MLAVSEARVYCIRAIEEVSPRAKSIYIDVAVHSEGSRDPSCNREKLIGVGRRRTIIKGESCYDGEGGIISACF